MRFRIDRIKLLSLHVRDINLTHYVVELEEDVVMFCQVGRQLYLNLLVEIRHPENVIILVG